MRVNIWIPDELIDSVRDAAHGERKSVSGYLVGLHLREVSKNIEKGCEDEAETV